MFKKLFIHSPARYIVSVVILVGVLIAYNSINGWGHLVNYSNAFFISGGILIALGLISMVDYYGGYNIARYIFVRRDPDGKRKSLAEYNEDRKEKLKHKEFRYFPYLLLGILAIIASAIILIINSNIH